MAFIGYYFHWPEKEVLAMEHWERRMWCEEISRIHQKLNSQPRSP